MLTECLAWMLCDKQHQAVYLYNPIFSVATSFVVNRTLGYPMQDFEPFCHMVITL